MHQEYPFTPNFINIHGHRLHYVDEGQGAVIVMVHGNPTWSFYYRNLITVLSRTHRVLALDNIGCGLSDKPQHYDYTLKNHIKNLTQFLEKLKIERCSLVVHDWGGAIGFGYIGENLNKIEKVVVHNTAAYRSTRIPLRIWLCRLPVVGEFLVRGLNAFAWPATFMAASRPIDKKTKQYYLKPYNSWKNRIAVYRFVRDIPLEKSHKSYQKLEEIEKSLSAVRDRGIPLLILWGGKDFCFNRYFFEEWCQRFPKAQHRYFDSFGHYLLEDGKDDVLQYIERFFNEST